MKIAVPKERRPHETRVAATPESVKKLKGLGFDIVIESGAGEAAAYFDRAYADAGAEIAAAGVLRMTPFAFIRQLLTFRASGPGRLAGVGLVRRFSSYFVGTLARIYLRR